ncbi:MAG TPA: DUF502 domain-containing protein [Gemmatales bacterium]|nr:DUF502 domain-containing protein [Gemmatales bacterium]HMP61441.1 DUF502 domain-containing protein [Gemmatales bacterium]
MSNPLRPIFKRAVRLFLAGALALLPLVVTIIVVVWVAGILLDFLGPKTVIGGFIRRLGVPFADGPGAAYAIGTLFVLGLVFGVGILVEMGARGFIQPLLGKLFKHIPVLGPLYGTAEQVVDMLQPQEQGDLKKMKAVFVRFGGESGCGFLALLVSSEPRRINNQDYLIVIVPTAPVPVGGGLLFVPATAVEDAQLSVDALMSIYVSMGVSAGQFLPTGAGPGR